MKPGYVTKVRETLGLNQLQFAARLGTSGACVSRWESGKSKPQIKYRAAIKAAYQAAKGNAMTQQELPLVTPLAQESVTLLRDFNKLPQSDRAVISQIIGNL